MLNGNMMDRPLLISSIIDYAAEIHGEIDVVSATVEGGIHRYSYCAARARIVQLAHALVEIGVKPGDRVATMAWNGYRHFELYYAISSIGAVCHTVNPRLFPEQLTYIINHARDSALFFDADLAGLVAGLRPDLPDGMKLVAMTDEAHMPSREDLDGLLCYEALIIGKPDTITWPEFDENTAAALCYTSGTTGAPKGALYSHRSTVLHALFCLAGGVGSLAQAKSILPVVPLFHVNAWGLAYAGPLRGIPLVFPGPRLDGDSLFDLMDRERAFSAWGVPTVWLALLETMKQRGRKPSGFGELVVGGSAASQSLIRAYEADFDVDVIHAWGMTEMSPIGSFCVLPPRMQDLPHEERVAIKASPGRRMFGVEMKIVDEDGVALPHDGKAFGELHVRGQTVIKAYHENPEASAASHDAEGWFGTGDVAKITPDGFLMIVDRTKDLVKSGGEWISSIDVENAAMAHPGVAQCAVIGVPHPKWVERPLLIVVPADRSAPPEKADVLATLAATLAKWQLPDDIVFVDDLPLTATGKVSKLTLREMFG